MKGTHLIEIVERRQVARWEVFHNGQSMLTIMKISGNTFVKKYYELETVQSKKGQQLLPQQFQMKTGGHIYVLGEREPICFTRPE